MHEVDASQCQSHCFSTSKFVSPTIKKAPRYSGVFSSAAGSPPKANAVDSSTMRSNIKYNWAPWGAVFPGPVTNEEEKVDDGGDDVGKNAGGTVKISTVLPQSSTNVSDFINRNVDFSKSTVPGVERSRFSAVFLRGKGGGSAGTTGDV